MVHGRKFQLQDSLFFGSYIQVFTVLEFVLSAVIMHLDDKIAHANCYL